jgi:prepilin signal peptidase PulO-like enzyme (type II secretory pathway)
MTQLLEVLKDYPFVWALMMVGTVPLILFGISFFLKRHTSAWSEEERGFKPLESKWRYLFYYSLLGGWVLSMLGGFLSNWNLYAMVLLGVISYVLIFSTITDIIVHKAPKEVARYGIYISLVVSGLAIFDQFWNKTGGLVNPETLRLFPFVDTIWEAQLYTVLAWLAVPLILILVSRGGLGMADVRLLILVGVGLSWWVGLMNMLVAFFIANVLQVLAFIPGQKLNWGRMIERPNGKSRRAIPFIPALAISFLTMSFVAISQF